MVYEENSMKREYVCCYCKKHFNGIGNNPNDGIHKDFDENEVCCNDCNISIVIPNRILASAVFSDENRTVAIKRAGATLSCFGKFYE